ncbi:hypothetical protein SAMN06297129_3775 [Pseudooceanicola antarcticus]|uniref:Mobilisation protein (MobC) n=1 Tax=Pseudooceanicola antarcticus TaxID=1247613 RepID=A0A285JI62_9RHOB|nr:hypothetical protein [Pseudooceanicola antarcticus]SNY59497.1 hypothetical protein SAMN06297129_3775 [Pseudooceanicola antarcticus]
MTNQHLDFNQHSGDSQTSATKTPTPFSLRFTFEERAKLADAANGVPLGTYIKAVLFQKDLKKVRRRGTHPVADHRELARVLSALGSSRLSNNVNQLAKAVHTGSLPVNPDTESELRSACADIAAMRSMLIVALGLESEGP